MEVPVILKVLIKLFATLRDGRFKMETWELPAATHVGKILQDLDIGVEEVAIILVNGRNVEEEYVLHDGDTLALFPPVGGG